MAYTTINKPTDHFDTLTYTGDGSTNQEVNGLNFTPSYIWIKGRDTAAPHTNIDSVRGGNKWLKSNETAAEETDPIYGWIDSFDSDGFTTQIGSHADPWNVNKSGETYVAWNWKANGAGSANTDGSQSATVSVNTTAGFSIVKFVNVTTATTNTFGHGLSVPQVIIMRSLDSAYNWDVYHHKIAISKRLILNSTSAESSSTYMNSTSPTSSVFTVKSDEFANNDNCIAYCFAEKQGYSKFGSYTGNGNADDGTFVYTGFKVGWLMIKKISGTSNWTIWDSVRQSNEINKPLWADLNSVEAAQSTVKLDLLSNGFKIRGNGSNVGSSGGSYIYMAFAEAPLVGSNNVPCTAR